MKKNFIFISVLVVLSIVLLILLMTRLAKTASAMVIWRDNPSETIQHILFTNGITGTQSYYAYQGPILIHLWGTGEAAGNGCQSDALYLFGEGCEGGPYRPDPFSVPNWTLSINGLAPESLGMAELPPYSGSHEYWIEIDVPSSQYLNIGVSDYYVADNSGEWRYLEIFEPETVPPTVEFSASPLTGEAPLTVNFTDLSSNSPTSWSWSFDDGGTSTERNPSHLYTNPGVYTVTLTVNNDAGSDTVTKTNYITVNLPNNPPIANDDTYATNEDTTLNVAAPGVLGNDSDADGDPLTAVLVTGPNNGTLMFNGNGSFSYAPNSNFNGTDSFTYVANDGQTDSNVATVTITINPVNDAPVANDDVYATTEDTTLNVVAPGVLANDTDAENNPLTAVYVAGPSNGSLSLSPDGWFSYRPIPGFVGTDSFSYRANDGQADSNIATVTIAVNEKPAKANFTASPTLGEAPLTVNFTDLSTGDPYRWDWDFGDGGTSTERNPSHTYNGPGIYTVSLAMEAMLGQDFVQKIEYITVTPQQPKAPIADFSSAPTEGIAPLTVNFTDLSSNNPTSWSWNFGDGATSAEQHPSHTYSTPGTYTVKLTASNVVGSNEKVKNGYIVVNNPPPPPLSVEFSASPTSGPAPLTVNFADQSMGAPTRWAWDFGDGSTTTSKNPSHTYNTVGVYTVKLTVSDEGGSNNSLQKLNYITVTTPPVLTHKIFLPLVLR